MKWPGAERWSALWKMAGAAEAPVGWYERLASAYAEPHRHYHNQQHVRECLAEFDQARHLAANPAAVELAVWFHDVVYDPRAGDNEEQSASLLKRCAVESRMNDSVAEAAAKLVMAARHHEAGADSNAALVVDVDLSILGQGEERFSEYERQIRQEYGWVLQPIFAFKRAQILNRFLSRPTIFATDWFRTKYEQQARRNLKALLANLRRWT
jgi:predicted metal-dependent HD superfamily phosphohydrolase